jgi:hypothetical protein
MSTVPKADTPPPENNAKTLILTGSEGLYVRPASGGAPQPGRPEGTPAGGDAPAGNVPGYAVNWAGNAPSAGGYQVGPDMGHGAPIVTPSSGDRPSGGKDSADMGTVGSSGNQGAGPGPTPMAATGMPDIDNDGDSL